MGRSPVVPAVLLWSALSASACTQDYESFQVAGSNPTGAGGAATAAATGEATHGATSGPSGPGSGGDATGGGGAGATGGGGGARGSSSSTSSGAGGSIVYTAVVADCIDTAAPNPDSCETESGPLTFFVDTDYTTTTGTPRHGFVRFDLDGDALGKVVTEVKLACVVANLPTSESVASGEIWEVEPFDHVSLYSTVPLDVATTALAADQGAVAQGQTVEWSLPTSLIAPNGVVYLGVRPTSGDAPRFWNTKGSDPPRLEVTYQ